MRKWLYDGMSEAGCRAWYSFSSDSLMISIDRMNSRREKITSTVHREKSYTVSVGGRWKGEEEVEEAVGEGEGREVEVVV